MIAVYCDSRTMWGDHLRVWFELFAGMVVYPGGKPTSGENVGWLNVNDIEDRFRRESLTFHGRKYDPSDIKQKNELLEAIVNNASALCYIKLLERRRQIDPPSLDYRVTRLGRRVDRWGYGQRPGIRKRLVFFLVQALFWLMRIRKLVVVGAVGWATVNAIKFYSAALVWISNDAFAAVSAVAIALVVWIGDRLLRTAK